VKMKEPPMPVHTEDQAEDKTCGKRGYARQKEKEESKVAFAPKLNRPDSKIDRQEP
jgi:hypothetical protein